jgi:PIN domain nuclease of toxin-antitoxin system
VGTLLDAQALVALFRAEPGAHEVELVLRRGDVAMTAPNLAETLDVLARVDGYPEGLLRSLVEPLGIAVVPMTEQHAWRAAALRARHYARGDSELSLADCALVATATPADVIVTADRPVLRMAEAEGIATVALPDSGSMRS